MKIVRIAYPMSGEVLRCVPDQGQTMAIGDFDGVHLGHREVIGQAIHAAHQNALSSSVMTFHPHPRSVLGAPNYTTYLTPLERKLELLKELGVETVYLVTFDEILSKVPPEVFVEEMLKPLKVKKISVGFNFTFGHRGAGTPDLLRELGKGSFDVNIIDPFLVNGEKVSSTLVREALDRGDVERARLFLGRLFSVNGEVVKGEGRGSTIGVPTANLSVTSPVIKPANGVYAVKTKIESGHLAGKRFDGVMNIGVKPTFHNHLPVPTWEVHLFDFNGDVYGERMTIEFAVRIRDERKFNSVPALIEQIHSDMKTAKEKLNEKTI